MLLCQLAELGRMVSGVPPSPGVEWTARTVAMNLSRASPQSQYIFRRRFRLQLSPVSSAGPKPAAADSIPLADCRPRPPA